MIVARQFIAWYPCENGNRPVGYGMIGSNRRATIRTPNQAVGKAHTVPTGRVRFQRAFQAINCLATIIQSLRDAGTPPVTGLFFGHIPAPKALGAGYHHLVPSGQQTVSTCPRFQLTSNLEDEDDDDEDEYDAEAAARPRKQEYTAIPRDEPNEGGNSRSRRSPGTDWEKNRSSHRYSTGAERNRR